MKKQSILAILIAALLVLTIFTGCAANSKMAAADTASAPNGYYDSKQEAAAAETPMEAPAEPEEEFAYDTVATTEAGGGAAETGGARLPAGTAGDLRPDPVPCGNF